MLNTKKSITLKVVAGYLIVALLAALAIWFIYSRVVDFTTMAGKTSSNNEQLFLISEITNDLYETENISRRFIQSGQQNELNSYKTQLDSVHNKIGQLQQSTGNSFIRFELDSISKLLSQKTANLEELTTLRTRGRNKNYYSEVIDQLKKIDESFAENDDYKGRFSQLKPFQRNVLIKYLEYAKKDNANKLTNKTADSLVNSVKKVLSELQFANQQFQNTLNEKEGNLLDNDMVLNQQLRSVLSKIEKVERQASAQRSETSRKILKDSATVIGLAAAVSLLIVLLFLFLIVKDITRSQRYRKQLEDAKIFAESLLKSREQFMAAITHDLRSPLNTVIGYSSLMEKTGMNAKQSHYLQQIEKSSSFILHLVNDLLDLSKLEAGKMLVEELPFNPKKLIEDTVENALPAKKDKNVSIQVQISEENDTEILSDPFRIKQILANLVTNAYKFTEEGSIAISVFLKKRIEDAYLLNICVKDTGIGISEEKQEFIFEEFSQESSRIEKRYGGTGLGLSITKRIAELMGGSISLRSTPGIGSEFCVKLPVKKVRKSPNPEIVQNKMLLKTEQVNLKGKSILVADDDPAQLSLTAELLENHKATCIKAENGQIALKKLKKGNFDLVLTDIQMPKMGGLELIKNIRKLPGLQDLPVIALSGRPNIAPKIYSEAGFTSSLMKPYNPKELFQKIAEIFGETKPEIPTRKKVISVSKKTDQSSLYNLEEIAQFCAGDKEAMHTIITAFLEGSCENTKLLKTAFNNKDMDKMAKIAHKMLPMLKQMQAYSLVPSLETLEKRKKLSKIEQVSLLEEMKLLMEELQQEFIA